MTRRKIFSVLLGTLLMCHSAAQSQGKIRALTYSTFSSFADGTGIRSSNSGRGTLHETSFHTSVSRLGEVRGLHYRQIPTKLLASHAQATPPVTFLPSSGVSGVLFEPPDGQVYHGVGVTFGPDEVPPYVEAMQDQGTSPLIQNIFTGVPSERPLNFPQLAQNMDEIAQAGRIVQLSIAFQGPSGPSDAEIAESSQHDTLIDSYAKVIRDFDQPVFVRLGFEFNGFWNGYTPVEYVKAFRKIVDRFKANGVTRAAYIWCYEPDAGDDFDAVVNGQALWFPGNEYVDWFGLDVFQSEHFDPLLPEFNQGKITKKGKSERFLTMARDHGRPVFLAETSPFFVHILPDASDPGLVEGEKDWNAWFDIYFKWMASHSEIKAFVYLNQDWSLSNDPDKAKWGDSRMEINSFIREKYREEMRKSRYIHQAQGLVSALITSFAPASGAEGTSVTITGTSLTGATAVTFNGTSASFTADSDTQITASVPSGATSGLIRVTTAVGTAISSNDFIVLHPPVITSFTPVQGAAGAIVTITGSNFGGATEVKFNGMPASFTIESFTEISALVPAGTTTGPINVINADGTATTVETFTVLNGSAPVVVLLTPNGGEKIATEVAFTIRWVSSDDEQVANQSILLSADGGATFAATIANNLPGTASSFVWTPLAGEVTTQARIKVVALDNQGNASMTTSTSDFMIVDVLPLIINIISPAENAVVIGPKVTVMGTVTDPAGAGIESITVNGVIAAIDVSAGTWTAHLNGVPDGLLTIAVTATNKLGKVSQPVTRNVTVTSLIVTAASYVKKALLITGNGFVAGATVKIDGATASVLPVVVNSTTITLSGSRKSLGIKPKGKSHTIQIFIGTEGSNVLTVVL